MAVLILPSGIYAQPMMGNQTQPTTDDHTAQEEAEGKEIWENLQAKKTTCNELSDENFGSLGEYFMGQSIGNTQRHAFMNQMMKNMMGEAGEEQMHVVMGKRMSGCDTSAVVPSSGTGFMPMMNMMMGGWNGFGLLGWIPMLLFWVLLILGVVALLRYLGRSGQQQEDKTPLTILKERYARGEIDKKEFEQKKKEIV